MRHLVTLRDVTTEEIQRIFALTSDLKTKLAKGIREPILPGRVMALVFEKQSLRTRVSFEAGMAHMGGSSIMLGDDAGFGKRERIDDFSRVLSEYIDVLVMRCKLHSTVEEVAKYASCSVINGLTDQAHPCQALADLYTIQCHVKSLNQSKLAWVGDANNVARSLALACGRLGVHLAVANPQGYGFSDEFIADLSKECPGMNLTLTSDPVEAVRGANAVYTDVWASMGQEKEQEQRRKDFAPFQVNGKLMAAAPSDALFMHCLPAKRGEEVTDEVMDSPNSVIVEQAGNRMHVQKGILAWLLAAQK
ncbi:ornithine carbamoyltransferase [Bythopirellula polymerisocia]|uniref:Ornithine carbamoyltransferase n=1 Tax=Bythopirellula polymerisocia TaxID=2528003 RepID=A0A5C6CV88_9BACT|nr:ornithine carbamoyltransferase [Bythopirellula polymerisocia]TWU28500.1 Ornithine carbamoyltransferase [Bythopirellula polymerisocia]